MHCRRPAHTLASRTPPLRPAGWLPGPRADGPCTIPRFPADQLTADGFAQRFQGRGPVVVTALPGNQPFRAACHRDALLAAYGGAEIVLSTANTFSHDKVRMPLSAYVAQHVEAAGNASSGGGRSGRETLYHFGDNNHSEWGPLLGLYTPPALVPPHADVALSFGLGGPGSGVPFHVHGPVWGEAVLGRKLWLLYPPDRQPPFDGDERSEVWLQRLEAGGVAFQPPLRCALGEGEAIYLPDGWWHSTVNLDQAVFVSSFLRAKDGGAGGGGGGGGGAAAGGLSCGAARGAGCGSGEPVR